MAKESWAHRLYAGDVSYDFIGHRRIWYGLSLLVILVGIVSLAVQGINPSIDFKGGAVFEFPSKGHSIAQARDAVTSSGISPQVVQSVGQGRFRVETGTLTNDQVNKVEDTVAREFGLRNQDVTSSTVGATWGSQITRKAVTALIVFLVAVVLYLSVRYEWKLAVAAIIAVLHDLVVTAGVYSLSGLQVSPETIVALLTILGYSLYDTVVVFDKVRENTVGLTGGSRMTYSQAANLGINQTLIRSINTSVIGLLPVAGLLIIGAGLLGAGSLEDLSVAMLIGLITGSYSSIFIATPLAVHFKEREPQMKALARRVAARQAKETTPAVATVGAGPGAVGGGPADLPAAGDEDGAREHREPGVRPAAPPSGSRRPAQQPRRRRGGRPGRKRR